MHSPGFSIPVLHLGNSIRVCDQEIADVKLKRHVGEFRLGEPLDAAVYEARSRNDAITSLGIST
jgi:hypothetical protein